MKKAAGPVIFILIIAGFIGFFIISTIIDDANAKKAAQQYQGTTDVTGTGEESKGWPPAIDNIKVEAPANMLQKNYYLILDGSGSMSGEKLKVAKEAINRFITLVPESANIGLAVFDLKGLSERAPIGSSRETLANEIGKVTANGYTPLASALDLAYGKINIQAAKQLGYGEYNIVVVTDGEASEGEEPNSIVNTILGTSPVVIHTIGFQIGTTHSLNQPGRILYKSANNLEELSAGLEDVLAELEDFSVTQFDNK